MRLRLVLLVVVTLALMGIVAAAYTWPAEIPMPGPGGFATVTIEHPVHGARIRVPNTTVHLRTDNSGAKIRVLLDEKVIGRSGEPSPPGKLQQIEFSDQEMIVDIPVRGLAPGVHSLGIERGIYGTAHRNGANGKFCPEGWNEAQAAL